MRNLALNGLSFLDPCIRGSLQLAGTECRISIKTWQLLFIVFFLDLNFLMISLSEKNGVVVTVRVGFLTLLGLE